MTVEVPVHHTKHPGLVALIDDDDINLVSAFRWQALIRPSKRSSYAQTTFRPKPGQRQTIQMHRLLIPFPCHGPIDHIDGNGLNNQRNNLRWCTNQDNMANSFKRAGTSSRFKGVCWNKGRKRWEAYIKPAGRRVYLGLYDDEVEAALAYDAAARATFGSFARLNFPHANVIDGLQKQKTQREGATA